MANFILDKFKNWHGYTIPSSFLSIRVAISLIILEVVGGTLGFVWLEGFSIQESFYMTIITISTVGFAEVRPLHEAGQIFTSGFILVNIGVFSYGLAVFSSYIVQGEIFKKMHLNLINSKIEQLENHVILCGYGKYGKKIVTHFNRHGLQFVVVEKNPEEIRDIQNSEKKMLYLEDDATHDEALIKAGIQKARALISALPLDADNVFTVLTARQLNPGMNIISRAKDFKSEKKLFLAGANHVVMPEQIGGFYMAALVGKPGAADFFSMITKEFQTDIGFEEIRYEDLPEKFRDKSIQELTIRQLTGTNVIGFKDPEGSYEVNPSPDTVLIENSSFIVLGNMKQLGQLRDYFKISS